jgi:hypothetical protein
MAQVRRIIITERTYKRQIRPNGKKAYKEKIMKPSPSGRKTKGRHTIAVIIPHIPYSLFLSC